MASASTSLRLLITETETSPRRFQMCLPIFGATSSLLRALQMKPAAGKQEEILVTARAQGKPFQEVHLGKGFQTLVKGVRVSRVYLNPKSISTWCTDEEEEVSMQGRLVLVSWHLKGYAI